ncbi:MAG: alpha-galactosidase [Clostridia bacterium]|nr:alpha-galactosidase [Clostridia bacterium]
MRKFVLDPQSLPVSFELGGTTYRGMPENTLTEQNGTHITYTALIGEVEVRAECVAYDDFDASEWTVYFTNRGTEKSPVLRHVYAIHTVFEGENDRVYTCNGDYCSRDGYSTAETILSYGYELRQSPFGGRSCDRAFPYQRLTFDGHGHNIAIGWPGKWESLFKKVEGGIRYWAAQQESAEDFNISILPGETIRTPLIVVVSFEGTLEHGINVWRRWYLKHVGTAKPLLQGAYAPPGTIEFTHATEENQLEHIRLAKEHGIDINLWWLDAGWYYSKNDNGHDDWWGTVGDWTCDTERFPRGLAPIGEECEKNGIDFLVWFEAERVTAKSKVLAEHPEWIISAKNDPYVKMLDLSQKDCCDYLIKKIGDVIEESHIKIYRQDYNFCPHPIWQEADAADRRGATENLYVQGYLRFWDALKERFPDLLIDSCASGGRRNDIETMRRSVPLHETDYGYGEHPVQQSFMQTLYTWIPYFRGFGWSWERADGSYEGDGPMMDITAADEFNVLASFAPALNFASVILDSKTEEDFALAREYADLFYRTAPVLCTADFYALTPYHKSRFKWTVWQFDEPEKEHGIFEVIRNNGAPEESKTVSAKLREGTYRFTNMRTGEEFVQEGTQITFRQPIRSVALWEYQKI